jgi:dipeptidase E
MKLLLVSKEKFLIQKGYSLLDIPKDKLRIGYITTALKVVEDLEYLAYMKEYEKEMVEEGIYFREFNIKDKTEKEIREFFADKNVVQVSGGNPFYLLKSIYESGFDKVLKDLLNNGLCYVGCSSGSSIMCPTIEVGGWKTTRNKHGVTNFTALGYVPFLIKSHYTDDLKEKVLEKVKTLKYPLRVLRDNQAFFIKDNSCIFIGDDEEVKL